MSGQSLSATFGGSRAPLSGVYAFPGRTGPAAPTEHPRTPQLCPGLGTGRIVVRSPGASSICKVSGSKILCPLGWFPADHSLCISGLFFLFSSSQTCHKNVLVRGEPCRRHFPCVGPEGGMWPAAALPGAGRERWAVVGCLLAAEFFFSLAGTEDVPVPWLCVAAAC